MEEPFVIKIQYRGIVKSIAAATDTPVYELQDLLTALFLSSDDCVSGLAPVGFVIPPACFVSLKAACDDLRLLADAGDAIQLLVSFESFDQQQGSNPEETVKDLTTFLTSLSQHGLLREDVASVLRLALEFPEHRDRLAAAYHQYCNSEIDVSDLVATLKEVAGSFGPDATSPSASAAIRYVNAVTSDGFLSPLERKFIVNKICAGDPQVLALYRSAQASGDDTLLNRGLASLARQFLLSSKARGIPDLDLSSGDDDGDGDEADLDDEDDEDDEDDDSEEEEDDDVPVRGGASDMRPTNPTPSASELIRIIDQLLEDGEVSVAEAEHLRHLSAIEDELVAAAFEVYEQDEDHDEDELKDTLIRIAKLASARPGFPSEATLLKTVANLQRLKAISTREADALRAGIELGEDEMVQCLQAYEKNKSVPEFRLALTSFMEEAGLLQSSEDEESGENLHARAAAPDLSRVAAAHAELVSHMRADGKITAPEATTLYRLFAEGDEALLAAWHEFYHVKDLAELEDTMYLILQREAEMTRRKLQAELVSDLVKWGKVPADIGASVLAMLPREHKVVSAAFDAFESDGDIEDLVETLCLIHEHGSSSGSPVAGARSPAASSKPPQPSPTSREPADADIAFVSICRALYESGSVLPDEAHGLVELMHARDPRILAARDVYAAGRDEEDLRDTLTLIAKLASAEPGFANKFSHGDSDEETGEILRVPSSKPSCDPAIVETLERVFATACDQPSDEFSSDDATALVTLAKRNDPSILAAVDVYQSTGDVDDFRDTLRRIARFATGGESTAQVSNGRQETPGIGALGDNDWSILRRAAREGGLSGPVVEHLVELGQASDLNVVATMQVYNIESDYPDLVDSLKRIAQRLPSEEASSASVSPSGQYQLLSDLAASGSLTGLRYRHLLHLLRSGDDNLAAVFEGYDSHRSKQLLTEALCSLADEEVSDV